MSGAKSERADKCASSIFAAYTLRTRDLGGVARDDGGRSAVQKVRRRRIVVIRGGGNGGGA